MAYSNHLNFVPADDLALAFKNYQEQGDPRKHRIFTLTHPQGHAIRDRETFYAAMIHTFPMNPPLSHDGTYASSAILAAWREGLASIEEDLIDIVWCDVDQVAQWSIPTLIEGVRFLLEGRYWLADHFWGKRRVYTRILLVYSKDDPAFQHLFWC